MGVWRFKWRVWRYTWRVLRFKWRVWRFTSGCYVNGEDVTLTGGCGVLHGGVAF